MSVFTAECIERFERMCMDGFEQGWHCAGRRAGNLTYRMTEKDVEACEDDFEFSRPWVEMGVQADNLKGAYFLTTGSGKFMRNVPLYPAECLGIVQNERGRRRLPHRLGPRGRRQADERVPDALHEPQHSHGGDQRRKPRHLPLPLPEHHCAVHARRA